METSTDTVNEQMVVVILDTLKEITTITLRESETGDTLRITTVTDRTRASTRDRYHDVQEKLIVRTDTVYLEKQTQNINLGGLVIDDNTTVADFSAALISCNEDWEEGDQLSFFYGVQTHDAVTNVPRAKVNGSKVVLDLTDATPLMLVVNTIGFCNVGSFLGMSQPITESAAAWVHSREKDNDFSVSTQYLFVDPAVYASYQGQEAFNVSVNSYGGTSKRSAFLSPKPNQPRNATDSSGH